jgi:hypothetical protein
MHVETITMDRDIARQKFEQYRAAVRRRADATDRILMRTYKQLAEGRSIINLVDVMKEAGVDELHRPSFAIARADAAHVWFTKTSQYLRFSTYAGPAEYRAKRHNIEFSPNLWPECSNQCYIINPHIKHPRRLRAMVPLIPPHLRPSNALSNYHILWDVKGAWEEVPPRDPFLLKRIEGDLYAVLAVWDLTDLEMQVLKGVRGT